MGWKPSETKGGMSFYEQLHFMLETGGMSIFTSPKAPPARHHHSSLPHFDQSDRLRLIPWKDFLKILITERAQSSLQLTRESKERYIPQTSIAAVQTRLGRNEQALDTLAKAVEEKDVGLVELKVEPVFEPLRSNSKFSELLRRVGLPQ